MKIGIGITTRNRREVAEKSINEIRKFAPKDSKIVVIDDASDIPYPKADFRFQYQAGIAKAKNKCLELLDDCDHIFVFDDDCYPVRNGWAEAYISTGLNHASFNFIWRGDGYKPINYLPNNVVSWSNPRGCLLYFTKKALEVAGGMDEGFSIWGWEHPDYSRRCWLLGINPCPFPDLKGSEQYFYSYDMHSAIKSTVLNRGALIKFNLEKYNRLSSARRFVPYKKNSIMLQPTLMTCYFNGSKDPQRNEYWSQHSKGLSELILSCQRTATPLIVFHDCLDEARDSKYFTYIRVAKNPKRSPLSYRWLIYKDYLEKNHHSRFFCVDATDVRILHNPLRYMDESKVYVGDEIGNTWKNTWVERHNEPHIKIKDYRQVKEKNLNKVLLNAGIIGGKFENIFPMIEFVANHIIHEEKEDPSIHTDMAIVNYFVRKHYDDILVSGEPLNTKFKQFEYNSRKAWIQHK